MSRLRRGLAWLVVAASLATVGHVAAAVATPLDSDVRMVRQLTWLDAQVSAGAGAQMQAFFPEGDFFTTVLSGIAAAQAGQQVAGEHRGRFLELTERLVADARRPELAEPFGTLEPLPHGAFYHGWMLILLVERAKLSTDPADTAEARAAAVAIQRAFENRRGTLLPSYDGGYWICDNVVALAALRRADRIVDVPDADATIAGWVAAIEPSRDPTTGLFPHMSRADGHALEGPRATSQAIIQTYWRDVDPLTADRDYERFTSAFVVRRAGLVGLAEYPHHAAGGGDVDSGPLILGVSPSATVVGLAAARAHGDLTLARTLTREGELLGLGVSSPRTRRYLGGALPVGDAFLAWARSTPPGPAREVSSPAAWWPVFVLAAALPGAVAALALRRGRLSRARSAPGHPERRRRP